MTDTQRPRQITSVELNAMWGGGFTAELVIEMREPYTRRQIASRLKKLAAKGRGPFDMGAWIYADPRQLDLGQVQIARLFDSTPVEVEDVRVTYDDNTIDVFADLEAMASNRVSMVWTQTTDPIE
jgi:hypothetical protein